MKEYRRDFGLVLQLQCRDLDVIENDVLSDKSRLCAYTGQVVRLWGQRTL